MPAIRREHAFSGFVWVLLTFSTVLWTLADRTPPAWDPSDHIVTAYEFYRPLSHGQLAGFLHEFFRAPHSYAPLYHVATSGLFLVLGASRLSGIAANFFGLALLLISVGWIGGRLYPSSMSNMSGTVAALLAVCYHFPAWLIHDAFLDYLLTAMVALSFALLLRAHEFHIRSDAILFGISAGLGLLTKQTFFLFFILPGAFLWTRALLRHDRRALVNMVLSVMIAILIASIWYIPHLDDIVTIYRINASNAAVEHEKPVFSFYSFGYYWGVLGDLQLQLPFGLLFIAGTVYSIRRRLRQDWMLYLWILSGILAFTLIANKDTRYTVPILPAVALLSVSWLDRVRPRVRSLATAAIVLWAFMSFGNAQWPSENRELRVSVTGLPVYILAGNTVRFDHQPLLDDWSVPAIVRAAAGKRLGVVPNLWQLNSSNAGLYARLLAPGPGSDPLVRVVWLGDTLDPDRLAQCDYVLARNLENADRVSPLEIAVADYLKKHSDGFKPIAVFVLPHAQEAVLYRRSVS